MTFYQIAVAAPIADLLTYTSDLNETLVVGQSVIVPLSSRKVAGVIIAITDEAPPFKTKSILSLDNERPTLSQNSLEWLKWLSSYYIYPFGQVIDLSFPPLKKSTRKKKENQIFIPQEHTPPPHLTVEQKNVLSAINQTKGFQTHLLFGVTGSGKTEVYLQLLYEVLKNNGSGLVLVPEISLTPQLIARFAERFPDEVAVIHSHLTEREKTEQWWQAYSGQKKILVGARSALFCPLPNLKLIVLDEEHEPSFKQDEKLKYHARDSAVMLAKILDIPVVLGSATPSLETFKRASDGFYHLHQMKNRVEDRSLPLMYVNDLRLERSQRKEQTSEIPYWLSEQLYDELLATLSRNEQSALFLNRRGLAQVALCESCGFTYECPNCAISLTVHHQTHLVCHYCDYATELKVKCSSCHEGEIKPLGLGTERVENDIKKLFPQARVARADRDEIQNREDLNNLITDMERGEIDILIGTQMIAKGLDFPKLTLVGLVMADVGFHLPDFRASERSFQLITQVAGRAGRHSKNPGRVIIQTYDPDHISVIESKNADYLKFAAQELTSRKQLRYPPFGKLALVRFQGLSLSVTESCAERFINRVHTLKNQRPEFGDIQALGPAPSPLSRLRGKYRFQVLIKSPEHKLLNRFCRLIISDGKWVSSGVKLQIDVDPINMM